MQGEGLEASTKGGASSTRSVRSGGWEITDEVVGFRLFGSERCHLFPGGSEELRLGSGPACELRLTDPAGGISRLHALMTRADSRWTLTDQGSKNGLSVDGIKRHALEIDPGMVVSLGSLRLVALSHRLMALRSFLLRLTGWSEASRRAADEAIQDLRFSQLRRDPIVLRGAGDLVSIARKLHSILRGDSKAFRLYDTNRIASDGNARSMANAGSLAAAISAAGDGTVCLRCTTLPKGFASAILSLRTSSESCPTIMICDVGSGNLEGARMAPPIVVPPLSKRPRAELDLLTTELLDEVARALSMSPALARSEREWIARSSRSITDVEKCLRRLLALKKARTLQGAADCLGMAPVSLRRWFQRRPLPSNGGLDAVE